MLLTSTMHIDERKFRSRTKPAELYIQLCRKGRSGYKSRIHKFALHVLIKSRAPAHSIPKPVAHYPYIARCNIIQLFICKRQRSDK